MMVNPVVKNENQFVSLLNLSRDLMWDLQDGWRSGEQLDVDFNVMVKYAMKMAAELPEIDDLLARDFHLSELFDVLSQTWKEWQTDQESALQYSVWVAKKREGLKVKSLLDYEPVGFTFYLRHNRAYTATYRKNADGLWDQIDAPERPLIYNMDPAHLGFCCGWDAINRAVSAAHGDN